MMILKKIMLAGIFLLILSDCVKSQSLKNGDNVVIALIDTLGNVWDDNNFKIGEFAVNDDVLDANGSKIGSIYENFFKDMNGDVMGSLDSSGNVYDSELISIGFINNNVIESKGNIIGYSTSPNSPKYLAAFYFFFNFRLTNF